MSDQEKFEATSEEVAFIRKLRAATEPLSAAEVGLLQKRRERGETGQAVGDDGGEDPVTLESIRPGLPPEKLSAILQKLRSLAR